MSNRLYPNHLKVVSTADGSKTIWNEEVGEHYHSRNGALQESQHVFLEAGLKYFLSATNASLVSVLEVGFGTGLNFLLTADYCSINNISLNYTGIEPYPLSQELLSQTGYEQHVKGDIWSIFLDKCHVAVEDEVKLSEMIRLGIVNKHMLDFNTSTLFDIVYYDAFASAHQPEMWTEEAITHTAKFIKPGGLFVTYAITGNLKRILKSLGFTIQKVPGAAGKREMLRALRSVVSSQ